MNPFLFIVGCPRSGTTLLQRIVDAHPLIAITPETHWIPSYYKKLIRKSAGAQVTRRFIAKLVRYHRFPQLGVGQPELEEMLPSGQPVSYARFVSALFDRYGRKTGRPLVGDKTPGYARSIRLLHALWPQAKFVHMIRDGRDVCLSAVHWTKPGKLLLRCATWKEDPVTTAALWWEWHVRLGREDGRLLGQELYYEIRYESLVAQPADACKQLCAFLGVPYRETMLRFHERRPRTDQAEHPWQPIRAGLRDWRSQMPAADTERFEAAAGDLLEELGYARAVPQPRRAPLEHAARIRRLFTEDACRQGHVVGGEW